MKKLITLCVFLATTAGLQAQQKTIITGKLKNCTQEIRYLPTLKGLKLYMDKAQPLPLEKDSTFTITLQTDRAEIVSFFVWKQGKPAYDMYVSPGSHNRIVIDMAIPHAPYAFSGPDSKETDLLNRLEVSDYYNSFFHMHRENELNNDTVASSVYSKINTHFLADLAKVNQADVSPAFRKKMKTTIQVGYWGLFAMVMGTEYRDLQADKEWFNYFDKAMRQIDLKDPEIMATPYANRFIYDYILIQKAMREKEKPHFEKRDDIHRYFFGQLPAVFEGEVLESAFVLRMGNDYFQGDFSLPVLEACRTFYASFPNSRFNPEIRRIDREYSDFYKKRINQRIHYIDSKELNTFKDVVKLFAGKTIYIDLWATWCGPCRSSFAFAKDVQSYAAKNKIQLVYISIDRPQDESKWKQMTQYYDLEGSHILANKSLDKELRRLFGKGEALSIPHYIIVDKQGNVRTANAADPSDMEKLKKQFKEIL